MAIKLDMEHAYDWMYWNFLYQALKSFRFHTHWINWIKGCVHALFFAILINSTPMNFFHSTIGLHQDCPLSLYLFIICADALSRALWATPLDRAIKLYVLAPGVQLILYLLFCGWLSPALSSYNLEYYGSSQDIGELLCWLRSNGESPEDFNSL